MFTPRPRPSAKARRTFYLVATPGNPNYGDEIIARRWLELLAKVEPDSTVWVDTPHPGPAATLLRDTHPDVRFTDTLFRLGWDAPDESPAQVSTFVREALDDPGRAPRWVAGIDVLRDVDVFHVLGGGYINAIWPRHTGIVAAARWLAAAGRARVAATGLGLLPIDDEGREVWRAAARDFDVLGVRDADSEALFDEGSRVRLVPDDVFLGGISRLVSASAPSAPQHMVCVQNDLVEGDFATIAATVETILHSWGATGETRGVVECIPRMDRTIYDVLERSFPGLRFYSLWEILADGFPAAAHQQWISSRYHPHVIAAATGASGVSLSVRGDYYDVKHAAVRRLGSRWTSVALGDTGATAGECGSLPVRAAGFSETMLNLAREIYRAAPAGRR